MRILGLFDFFTTFSATRRQWTFSMEIKRNCRVRCMQMLARFCISKPALIIKECMSLNRRARTNLRKSPAVI